MEANPKSQVDRKPAQNRSEEASGGRLDRMIQRSRILAGDVTEWVELRVQLLKVEIEEEVQHRLNKVIARIIIGGLAGLTGLFVLLTLAIGLGWWLGHMFWGFLIVTGLLLLGLAIFALIRPEVVDRPLSGRSDVATKDAHQ